MTTIKRLGRQGYELEQFHRNVSDEELIADLVRVATEKGRSALTFRTYNTAGSFSSSTVATRFGSWNSALERAGLMKTQLKNIPDEDLFSNIVEVWTKLGRQPKFRDLTPAVSAYSSATYADRFGGWRKALQKFLFWSRQVDSYVDVQCQTIEPVRRTSRNPSWRLRARVLMRDGATCRLCGANPQSGAKLHVDHIVPWSSGGETAFENLQILCEVCNIGKGDLMAP